MKPITQKKFTQPIIFIKILDNGDILTVDSKTKVLVLDKNSLSLKSSFDANISHKNYENRVVDFSSDGEYFATLTQDLKEAILYSVKEKKALSKVSRHQGNVSCVGIDPHNSYMFSCGEDGKTFAVNIKSAQLAFTLPVHVDTISDIVFSQNANWIATASYDKKILLFNLVTMSPSHRLIGHSAPVMKLQFLTNEKLFSVDTQDNAIIWDTQEKKVLKRLEGIHDNIVQVTTDDEFKFLFLATKLGYILVYDTKTYEQLSKQYIKLNSQITSLSFHKEKSELIIATQNNELFFYDIYTGKKVLKELVKNKDYDHIYLYIEKNPLLKYTKIYERIESLWELALKKAKLALENSDKPTAIDLFKSFKNMPDKNKIMQKVMREFEAFDKFAFYAKDGKLSLAYSLSNQHPIYKESKVYKSLESLWRKRFTLAQKYSLDAKGQEKARELLSPYKGVTEKTKFIKELFSESKVYRRFVVSLGEKDFKTSFELIKLHPFLKEFPEYESIINYGDTLYIKSQNLLDEGDTHSAIKMFRVLKDFPDFKEDIQEIIKNIELKQKFFNAISSDDMVTAYNILGISKELKYTRDGQILNKRWLNDLEKTNQYIIEGDIKGIKKSLIDYMQISSKHVEIGIIFSWIYIMQLEEALKQKKSQKIIETGVKNYILSFGLQDQISSFFEIFKRYHPESKLNLELQIKGSLEMWRPSMIVSSILD